METEYTDLLDNLAFRLEVPITHLWEVLVTQAPITASVDILLWLCSLCFCLVMYSLAKKSLFKNDFGIDDIKPSGMVYGILWGISAILLLAGFVDNITDTVTMLVNPEYWALQHLLTLKP